MEPVQALKAIVDEYGDQLKSTSDQQQRSALFFRLQEVLHVATRLLIAIEAMNEVAAWESYRRLISGAAEQAGVAEFSVAKHLTGGAVGEAAE